GDRFDGYAGHHSMRRNRASALGIIARDFVCAAPLRRMNPQSKVEELLKLTTGIDAASLGPTTVERAIHQRMTACKLKEISEYETYLRNSQVELDELIEKVVVPETWFFRDREPFA